MKRIIVGIVILLLSVAILANAAPTMLARALALGDLDQWFMHPLKATPTTTSVTCATTATAIPATALAGRRGLSTYNNDSVLIFIGGSGVTAANGMPLDVDAQMTFNVGDDVILYCIVSAGTANLRALELK